MEAKESDIWVLGEELMVEILTRVGPVKCTVRCKLVCKFWCSLVVYNNRDSHWLRRWHRINPNNNNKEPAVVALFTTYESESEPRLTIDCDSVAMRLDFLPCNGQVCVLDSHKDLLLCCPDRSDHSCYYICNPLTKQWTALPPPPRGLLRHRQPTKEEEIRFNKASKVGFTVSSGRLTVVCIVPFQLMVRDLEPQEQLVRIWVLDCNGEWREVEGRSMFEDKRSCKKMVPYRGRLVWFSRQRHKYNYGKELSLLNCDFDSNDYTHLPLPPGFPGTLYEIYFSKITIGVCRGRLRLALLVNRFTKLSVWEMDDQKQEWDMVRELDLREAGESSKDWVRFRSIHERKPMSEIMVEGMALHPHDGDILYMVVTMTGEGAKTSEWSSHLFMCNLHKTTLDSFGPFPLMRRIPKSSFSCNHPGPHQFPRSFRTL